MAGSTTPVRSTRQAGRWRLPRSVAVPVAALIVGASVGVASAAVPAGSGVFSACYDSGGNVKFLDTATSTTCPKGWKGPVSWNQVGPIGPQGTEGPKGDRGPAGEPGFHEHITWKFRVDASTTRFGVHLSLASFPDGTTFEDVSAHIDAISEVPDGCAFIRAFVESTDGAHLAEWEQPVGASLPVDADDTFDTDNLSFGQKSLEFVVDCLDADHHGMGQTPNVAGQIFAQVNDGTFQIE